MPTTQFQQPAAPPLGTVNTQIDNGGSGGSGKPQNYFFFYQLPNSSAPGSSSCGVAGGASMTPQQALLNVETIYAQDGNGANYQVASLNDALCRNKELYNALQMLQNTSFAGIGGSDSVARNRDTFRIIMIYVIGIAILVAGIFLLLRQSNSK